MDDVRRDLSPASLVQAIEVNSADLLMEMGRLGGGEQRADDAVAWTLGGSPIDYHNCVVRADLAARDADPTIRASRERLRALGVPGTWHVGPSMRPTDLGERLTAAGFSFGGAEPGMAVDLHTLADDRSGPEGLRTTRVQDERTLTTWAHTLGRGFGEGAREANWVAGVYRQLGFDDTLPWRHYLLSLHDQPVATSTLYFAGGVAGIYFVMTVPEARGCGIGAEATLAPLRDARELGYRIGVLTSSAAGHPVYTRLGFRDCCEIELYEWRPTE